MAREKSVLSQLGKVRWEMWVENSILKFVEGVMIALASNTKDGLMSKEDFIIISQILVDDNNTIITDEDENIIIN